MQLLQIISTMDPNHGGPQECARQLACAFVIHGNRADIATLDSPEEAWADALGVIRLGPRRFGGYGYSDRLVSWIRAKARNYDAVLVHGLWQYHGLATWRALAGTGTPYFVFPHGMLDPWFKHRFPVKHFKKRLYWPWAEYRVLRDAAAVLFTCEEEKHLARETFRPYDVREAVVGCGIASPPAQPAQLRETFLARFPDLRNKRVLLFLGRVHPKKGCDQLIEAFADVAKNDASLRLAMVGPGEEAYLAALSARAGQLGVASRITWTGLLRDHLKWGAFYAAEAFVLPSHQENFGISVVEALACGVPVLVSNKVNIWREIVAGRAGAVADDNPRAITEMLREWMSLSAEERTRVGLNGRECFRTHFHIDATARNLLNTIRGSACKPPHMSAA